MHAPAASSPFGPAACGVVTRPGTAPTGRPRPRASRAVTSAPDHSPASTTTVIAASAAMMRFRAGNIHRHTPAPGPTSDTAAPPATMRRCRRALAGRIGTIRRSREHGDRRAARLERARVGGGVDPDRHAAHHGDPRDGEAPPERAGDVEPIRRSPPRADDRDRLFEQQVDHLVEPAGDVENRRRTGQRSEPRRVSRIASANGLQAGGTRSRAHFVDIERLELPPQARLFPTSDRSDQIVVAEREHLLDPAARLVEVSGKPAEQPRAGGAVIARALAHAAASVGSASPRCRRLSAVSRSAWVTRSWPPRSAIVCATRTTRWRPRALSAPTA